MSSECNNITLAIRNAKSEIVCVMCKQCLITANHDVCVLNYVNDMNSRADNQSASVSIRINQKKHKANTKKSKELGSKGSLASSRPSKPRTCLSQNRRDLHRNTPLERVEVIVMNGNPSRVNIKQLCGRDNSVSNQSDLSFDQYFELNELKAQLQAKDTVINKLKERIKSLSGNVNKDKEQGLIIAALRDELRKMKGKALIDTNVTTYTIDPVMLKVNVEPIAPRLLNNRTVYSDYLRLTQKQATILREVPSSNTKKDKIQRPPSSTQKNKVKAHPRTVKSSLKNKKCDVEPTVTANVQHCNLNANYKLICVKCNGCMLSNNHVLCVHKVINDVNAHAKSKSVKKNSKKKVWKPTGNVFTNIGYIWRPIGRTFTIVENTYPLTRFTTTTKVLFRNPIALETDTPKPVVTLVYSRKPRKSKTTDPVRKSKVGIYHETYVARSPQQNGVVERRNRTLIKVAHTMLIYAKAPLFLWAEAVATACYTQNRSIIHIHHGKTPYELLHDKPPDLSFIHVFGALCYPTNDSENLGKLQPKADIGIFIGYVPTKKAF
uniref:Retrovirus-related Pol polyprotein from transposon TNT 1-94 n=1 Tax=Tanacetum cinerariifolium TaxID=118510 RepID=A0A6L2K3E6_TANCI|nr:retrovirus-related Pol polyprotein from transposon TNT 1-94 [Tanacetum cinerariifolium]